MKRGLANQQLQTITVAIEPNPTTLYFSGLIAPLQVYSINSTIDGFVAKKYFEYGEIIKKGTPVLVLTSTQLTQDYQAALNDYLKAKKDYVNNQTELRGIDYLKQQGIISANEYLNSKSTAYDLQLAFGQATRKLQAILDKTANPIATNVFNLNIENIQEVNKALSQTVNTLKILSPGTGVALLPDKSGDGNAPAPLALGSQVKTGDPVLTIGDMTGITIVIKVNELHINDLKLGESASITGDAFPNITLKGKIAHIAEQGTSTGDSSSNPTFPVKIIVPALTKEQSDIIHVGMSAKVAITFTQPTIKIPIQAVFNKNGSTMVKVLDPKTNKPVEVSVVTGPTTIDSVEIGQGLKPGDKVVLNAPAD